VPHFSISPVPVFKIFNACGGNGGVRRETAVHLIFKFASLILVSHFFAVPKQYATFVPVIQQNKQNVSH
jgi:ABC-type sulfate transport system permease subunit